MIYSEFQGKQLSLLGFGAMRLPMANNEIDVALVEKMVAYAMENGVNYFDTAYPYHGGMSERVMGKILGKYPRNSFYLADKFPGHQTLESYEPAPIFEEQLRRCGVEYFDFYLLHNVYEKSMDIYLDPQIFQSVVFIMLRTVYFNHKFCFVTIEIGNVISDYCLTPEFYRIRRQKSVPQRFFFKSHILPKFLCGTKQIVVSWKHANTLSSSPCGESTFPQGKVFILCSSLWVRNNRYKVLLHSGRSCR